MAAFYLFPRLPFELRARIWELTVEPRTVEVRVKKEYGTWGETLHVTSSTPVPAVLHACHEARNQVLYQQAFNLSSAIEPRYVWVNFEIDMISIGDTWFEEIDPAEQLLIRRLTFERENGGLLAWHDAWEYVPWPCPKKNLRFIDKETGQIAVAEDLDRMVDEVMASLPNNDSEDSE